MSLHLTCSQHLQLSSQRPSQSFTKKSLFLNSSISDSCSFGFSRNSRSFNGYHSKSKRCHGKSSEEEARVSEENKTVSANGGSPNTSFLALLCPLLKLFSGGDPSEERNNLLEVGTTSLSSLARLPWGSRALPEDLSDQEITRIDAPLRLQLFEFEACPFCRRVREAITELDLSVEVYPCPKGSLRHRDMVKNIGGKEQFPFLVDPNYDISLYESGDIVKYLFIQYGQGKSPTIGLMESTLLTGWMPTILRVGRGMMLWGKAPLDPPPKKLELFSYENQPYARIVREALCELELPYILQNVGKGSVRSKLLLETSGSMESDFIRHFSRDLNSYLLDHLHAWQTLLLKVPYLIDPNTDTRIGDYKKILSYLFQTYSVVRQ